MNIPEIFETPMSARQFNRMQWDLYGDYVVRCIMNNVPNEPKERYFPGLPVNYGYALKTRFSGISWKKRKADFGFRPYLFIRSPPINLYNQKLE